MMRAHNRRPKLEDTSMGRKTGQAEEEDVQPLEEVQGSQNGGSKGDSGPRRLSRWSLVASEALVRNLLEGEMKCAYLKVQPQLPHLWNDQAERSKMLSPGKVRNSMIHRGGSK